MTQKTRRTSLFLTEQQLEQLAKMSSDTGAPQAELIRRAVDMYLSSKGYGNEQETSTDRATFR